jgi:hypothetical protein
LTTIKAIETHYAGCRFRSRLEARWAVFLDQLGIKWDYEPEGFELQSGRYLPDFWLANVQGRLGTTFGIWLEIKPPSEPNDDPRWRELAQITDSAVYVARGLPRPPHHSNDGWIEEFTGDGWDDQIVFCNCDGPWAMKYGPETNYHTDKAWQHHILVNEALTAARSARFEHGESG